MLSLIDVINSIAVPTEGELNQGEVSHNAVGQAGLYAHATFIFSVKYYSTCVFVYAFNAPHSLILCVCV